MMLASKKSSFLLRFLLLLCLLVSSAECEKPAKNAPSKTQPAKVKADKAGGASKAAGSPFAGEGQQIHIIPSQRYQMLARALGREPVVGEHVAARSEPDATLQLHQKLLEGVVTASQSCEQVDGAWRTVMRPDWPATAWDMLTTGGGGGCIVRNVQWVPVAGHSLTGLGAVRTGVDVNREAQTVLAERGCYSLTTNNCRHFVSALWDKIRADSRDELKKSKPKKRKRQVVDDDMQELFIRDFGFDARELLSLDDILFSRMIHLEDFLDYEFEYQTRSLLDDEAAEKLLPRKVPINTYAALQAEPKIVHGHVDLGAMEKCSAKNPGKDPVLHPITTVSSSTHLPSPTTPPPSPGAGCSSSTGQCDHDCGEAGYDKTGCAILAGVNYQSGLCKCNKPCQFIQCRLVVPEDSVHKDKKTPSKGKPAQPAEKGPKHDKKGGK